MPNVPNVGGIEGGVPRPALGPSGDSGWPIRITAPGRAPLDVSRDELAALIHEARAYLVRTHSPSFFPLVFNDG